MRLNRILPVLLAAVLAVAACDAAPAPQGTTTDVGAQPPVGMTRPDPKPENVTAQMIQQKQVVCIHVNYMNNLCDKWTWVSPDGFFDCAGDSNTYDGEITLHDMVNWTETCVWARPNLNHTSLIDNTMRDWDGAGSDFSVYWLVSRLHAGGQIWSGTYESGSAQSWLGPIYGGPTTTTLYPTFATKSLAAQN